MRSTSTPTATVNTVSGLTGKAPWQGMTRRPCRRSITPLRESRMRRSGPGGGRSTEQKIPKPKGTSAKRNNTPTDVTAEYFSLAKPGTGSITYQPGYDMRKKHEPERAGAKWIHDTFGGDVIVLTETNRQNEKTPDYLWRESFWDWKTVSTEKASNGAVRHGLQQIRMNRAAYSSIIRTQTLM